jgi:hypothetical protein
MLFTNIKVNGMHWHQLINFTKPNRYPHIFSKCAEIKTGKIKILSFGCSTGEECFSLREYFPLAEIEGVDINEKCLDIARSKNKDNNIIFNSAVTSNSFDWIFCMSVLCREIPDVKLDDCSRYYRFSQFENELDHLIDRLSPNGGIVIYNSNFKFCDTRFFSSFDVVPTNALYGSGWATKFDLHHLMLENQEYKDCVFLKC